MIGGVTRHILSHQVGGPPPPCKQALKSLEPRYCHQCQHGMFKNKTRMNSTFWRDLGIFLEFGFLCWHLTHIYNIELAHWLFLLAFERFFWLERGYLQYGLTRPFQIFGLALGIWFEPVRTGFGRFDLDLGNFLEAKLFEAMLFYYSMPMMSANEKNIIYSNNMEEKNKLLREFLSGSTNEDLRTLVNLKRQMTEPNSIVKRMVDYFKQNPIPLAPQANITEVRTGNERLCKGFRNKYNK